MAAPAVSLTKVLRTIVVVGVAVAAAIGLRGELTSRSNLSAGARAVATHVVSDETFSQVVEGLSPSAVEEILGPPPRTRQSLAEGYAWPEPIVVCWYYPAADLVRQFQVCFIAEQLVSRASYVPVGAEP